MRVTVITPPDPIVSLEEAKRHLIVEDDSRDAYIESLIAVATAWLDAPDGWLGRALGEQTLEIRFARWPRVLCLPYPPEIEIVSIKYVDPAGVEQSWPMTEPLLTSNTPAVRGHEGDIRVQWKAGYRPKDGKSTVPAPIRHAILLMVGHLFAHRDAVTATTAKPEQLPLGVDALLQPYRVMSV